MQIFVVGMHRSGTSVVSRVLNLMGLYFGPEDAVMKIGDDNPKGFWERTDVMEINDRLLESIDCHWHQVSSLNSKVEFPEQSILEIREEARNLILGMDSFRPWFIKDPRLCITLPFWLDLVELPVLLFVSRNSESVADSLNERNHFPPSFGKALREQYNFLAFQNMSDLPFYHLDFDLFMSDPLNESLKLYGYLSERGVSDLKKPTEKSIDAFLLKKEVKNTAKNPEKIGAKPSKFTIEILSECEKVIGDSLLLAKILREEKNNQKVGVKDNIHPLVQKQNQQEKEIFLLKKELESMKKGLENLSRSWSAQEVLKDELRKKEKELNQALKNQSSISLLEKSLTKKEAEILSLKRNEDELKRFVHLKSSHLEQRIKRLESLSRKVERLKGRVQKINQRRFITRIRSLFKSN